MRRVTVETDGGLSAHPAIVGSDEWWSLIRDGTIETRCLEGVIEKPLWTSMNDWPEVEIIEPTGAKSQWTRLGDARQYCQGRGIKLCWVEHAWKRPDSILGERSRIVLNVWLERGSWRLTAANGPGPGRHLEEGWEGGPA